MRMVIVAAVFAVVLLTAFSLGIATTVGERVVEKGVPTEVAIRDGTLLVNGNPFIVKGVTYSGVPIGEDPRDKHCPTCLSEDTYMHDLALMKAGGVNTVRILDPANPENTRKFLDAAYAHGIMAIIGTSGPVKEDASLPGVREHSTEGMLDVVKTYKDHPAVLMWMYGNEVNFWYPKDANVDDWYTLLDETAAAVKKEDPLHPVITGNNDLLNLDGVRTVRNVDVYGSNQYSLNDGSWNWFFTTYDQSAIGLPLMLTEFGADSWNSEKSAEDEASQARILSASWNSTKGRPGFIGAIAFEWADEWWKSENPEKRNCERDWQPFDSASLPDKWFSEECFGLVRMQENTNERVPKLAYYELQKEWVVPDQGSAPTISLVEISGKEVNAIVATYGGAAADVTLRYKGLLEDWKETPMRRDGFTYAAEISHVTPPLSYRIVAADEYGTRTKEGTVIV
ncbi:MAG: hypothetical protein HYS81_01790 [Candidatus Aenigmatarchaeota archaeon]|nr:MAG: hypothetical protein HYS81_01790 [Candidatus Aenigmarchaeota archaeon]